MDTLVDLVGFRKINGLSQKDVSEFLGISVSFISRIEKGEAKLPDDKINKILSDGKKGWSRTTLVPAYDRLCKLCDALYFSRYPDHLDDLFDNDKESDFSILEYEAPIMRIPESTRESIKMGRIGITDAIAETIIQANPTISKEWLMTGKGEMFIQESQSKANKRIEDLETEMRVIKESVQSILETIEELSSIIKKRPTKK